MRANPEVPCSRHVACTSSVRTRILTESNFFRVMENPIPGHIIEMWRVKVRIFSYFSRFVQNNGVPYTRHIRSNWATSSRSTGTIFPSFEKVRYETRPSGFLFGTSRYVKFPGVILHWNFTAREVSTLKFHGPWTF